MIARARARIALLVATAVLLSSAPAQAVAVTVIRRPNASPAVAETVVRIEGELLSIGIEVAVIDVVEASSVFPLPMERRSIRAFPRGTEVVIEVIGGAVPSAVDISIDGEAPKRFAVTLMSPASDSTEASERVAIRAIEVLRSSLFEIDLAARRGHDASGSARLSAAPPAASTAVTRAEPSPATLAEAPAGAGGGAGEQVRTRAGLEVGAASLTGLDGVGVAFLPLVRLGVAVRPRLTVQATLAGLGSRPTVTTMDGSAHVAQQFGLLGARYSFRAGSAARPSLSLAAGALHTAMDGRAVAPRQGHTVAQWSWLVDVGAGLEFWPAERYSLALAVHLQLAEPYVVMHFADSVVATSGRPNLLLLLTAGAWR